MFDKKLNNTRDNKFLSLFLSLILHLFIFLIIIFGLPFNFYKQNNYDYAMVLDVVKVSDITNIKTKKSNISPSQNIKNPDQDSTTKKEFQKLNPEKELQVENKKEEVKKLDTNVEEKKEIIPEKEKPKKPKEENKKTDQKPKEEKKEKSKVQKEKSWEEMMKSIDAEPEKKKDIKNKDKKVEDKKQKKQAQSFDDLENALIGETNKLYNSEFEMTISERDAIISEIGRYWNQAVFGTMTREEKEKTYVVLRVYFNPDASVKSVNIESSGGDSNSFVFSTLVNTATKSIYRASLGKILKKEQYAEWQVMDLKFNTEGLS